MAQNSNFESQVRANCKSGYVAIGPLFVIDLLRLSNRQTYEREQNLSDKFFLKTNQAAAVQIKHVLQTGIMTKCKILSDFNLTLFIARIS